MSEEAIASAFRSVPAHRRHLRHHRGAEARLSHAAIRRGATSARASPRPGRCPARPPRVQRRRDRRRRPGVRAGRRHLGAARGDRRPLQPALPARHALAVHRRERQRLGRRARGAHARGGQPRPRQPRPLPARLHRVRGAARHLQGVHRHPDPARGRARLRVLASTICAARCRAAGCRRCCCRTRATRPASSSRGDELARWVALARELDCALLIDEFYSHYIWTAARPGALPVESAARYVEDVDRDPVVIFDGLTKNWRYPGWRVTWTVGPKQRHRGGRQRRARSSTAAARSRCSARRSRCSTTRTSSPRPTRSTRRSARSATGCSRGLERARRRASTAPPDGTFYVWGNVAGLPPPLNDGMGFFRAALEQQGDHRARASSSTSTRASAAASAPRASAATCASRSGPSMDDLETALARLEALTAGRE